GGKGLFVKEIEAALLDGRADVAVHSAKDLPAELAPGCTLAAFPERADPRDALVARRPGVTLVELPANARVGTGSVRREAQLRRMRADLEVVPLRGNVPTRLRKLEEEGLDAVVLACAGLDRLGLGDRISERIEPRWLLPAVGQGTLALETRADDPLAQALAALDEPAARTTATAERAFLEGLGGDCSTPLAAYARVEGDRVHLEAMLCSRDGSELHRVRHETSRDAASEAGAAAAREVLAHGGQALLDALNAADPA
ncbi:MAG TPA: hydroxymethylbilane synthase, partial [Myxococcota bacterium]|nr:hydroxymethylbilane synthase [Myxococcota bacterium]